MSGAEARKEAGRPITAQMGAAPGDLIHVGQAPDSAPHVSITEFTRDEYREEECPLDESLHELARHCAAAMQSEAVSWIDVHGIHDPAVIAMIGDAVGLHPLTGEDIMNALQRPKVEDFADYRFLAVKMARALPPPEDGEQPIPAAQIELQHISIVVTERVVISFQERATGAFDPVREHIRSARGQVRQRGADYLAYALLDAVVDQYFAATDAVSERIEAIEEELAEHPDEGILGEIHAVKRDLIHLRRAVWPLREVTLNLQSGPAKMVARSTRAYLRDIHDHTVQVIELVDTMRELIGGVRDYYMTVMSNRMNSVMKVLTVIGTIFLPLTFIVGVYGMNLAMPEVRWPWAYPAVWGVMVAIAAGLLIMFRKKRWL